MPLMNVVDAAITFRIIRMLVTPWKDTEAYKLGIIDENGTPLKKSSDLKTPHEQAAYTVLNRLVFKLKRILGSIPFVNRNLASFAAALWLIKECYNSGEDPHNMEELFEQVSLAMNQQPTEELNEILAYMREEASFELGAAMMNEDGGSAGGAPASGAGGNGDAGGGGNIANNAGSGKIAGLDKNPPGPAGYSRKKLFRRKSPTQPPIKEPAPIIGATRQS